MGMWDEFGVKSLGHLIGGGINAGFDALSRYDNFRYNEMAADNADQRLRKQFEDLYSYPAQIAQLKKAGLSPALTYAKGAGGQGGATAPQGLGAAGVQGGYAPVDPMTQTQIRLAESQANLNDAEANNLKEDTTSKQIKNYIDNLTKETSIKEREQNLQVIVALGAKYLSEIGLNIAKTDKTNWETTWEQIKSNEELNLIRNQNALYLAQIATEGTKQGLNEQQTQTLSAQIDKWQMDVTQRYYELDIMSWNQEAQQLWWEKQANNLTNTLEFEAKKLNLELDFGKKKMWIDNVFDVGKTAMIATGMVFTRGSVNLNTPKVTFGKPKPVGFQ